MDRVRVLGIAQTPHNFRKWVQARSRERTRNIFCFWGYSPSSVFHTSENDNVQSVNRSRTDSDITTKRKREKVIISSPTGDLVATKYPPQEIPTRPKAPTAAGPKRNMRFFRFLSFSIRNVRRILRVNLSNQMKFRNVKSEWCCIKLKEVFKWVIETFWRLRKKKEWRHIFLPEEI